MFGEGLTHVRFVASNHIARRQFSILMMRTSAPIFRCSLNNLASSPTVIPWRTGIV